MKSREQAVDESQQVTFRHVIRASFKASPVATLVFAIPLTIGFFAKLSDHMMVSTCALVMTIVGAVGLYRKRKTITAVLTEKAKSLAKARSFQSGQQV